MDEKMNDILFFLYIYLIFGVIIAFVISSFIAKAVNERKEQYHDRDHEDTVGELKASFGDMTRNLGDKQALGLVFITIVLFWLPTIIYKLLLGVLKRVVRT